jgi:hypothetical protein
MLVYQRVSIFGFDHGFISAFFGESLRCFGEVVIKWCVIGLWIFSFVLALFAPLSNLTSRNFQGDLRQ